MTVDDNGEGLYSTGRRHGDSMHLSDFYPDRPGLELFLITELVDNRLLRRMLKMPREESKRLNRDFIRFVKSDLRFSKRQEEDEG